MAIFIVLWYYLLSTKISCLLHNNFGHTNILCGPSMIDCPETSGNLQKPAAVVFGRFLLTIFFFEKTNYTVKLGDKELFGHPRIVP